MGPRSGTPGTPRVLRAMNDRAALDLMVAHGPLTRTRIAELTGLSKPTAFQLLTRLTDAGLVRSADLLGGRPGPSAQLYEVDPAAAHVVALSAGPAGVSAAVADITGTVVGRARERATDSAGPYADEARADAAPPTARLVARAVDGALKEAGTGPGRPHTVVVGTPGAIDPRTGRLRYAPHLPGWHSRALQTELAQELGSPVVVENDVNLAAMAERHEGAARGHENFALIWADTGTGAAVVLDGSVLRGANGGAGEVGYMPQPDAPLVRDSHGHRSDGGFQTLVSAPAVRELADGGTLAEAMADAEVRNETARRLANGIATVVAVVDPELVVLSGSVAQAGGDPLRARVEEELTGLALSRPLLRVSVLGGDPVLGGALLSALALARDEVFDTG